MYALCVSGAVNTQGFVWKFFYALYINFHSFIHSSYKIPTRKKNQEFITRKKAGRSFIEVKSKIGC